MNILRHLDSIIGTAAGLYLFSYNIRLFFRIFLMLRHDYQWICIQPECQLMLYLGSEIHPRGVSEFHNYFKKAFCHILQPISANVLFSTNQKQVKSNAWQLVV